MSSIWKHLTEFSMEKTTEDLNKFKAYVSENTRKAQIGANKILRVSQLHHEIFLLASSVDTYDDEAKLNELKSKAKEFTDLKQEINTYCQSHFRL